MREHVERLGVLERVATCGEVGGVARQRRRVARHIDDAPRRELGDARDDARVEPGARWIDDDDVRTRRVGPLAAGPLAQHRARLAGDEACVVDAVPPSVGARLLDRVHAALDPDRRTRGAREQERERAGAAVEIEHVLVALEPRGVERGRVEMLGLHAVRLQEGGRGGLELEPEQPLEHAAVPDEDSLLVADRDVRARPVDRQRHRAHGGASDAISCAHASSAGDRRPPPRSGAPRTDRCAADGGR